MTEFKKINENVWEVEKEGDMKVPARIYGDEEIIKTLKEEERSDWSSLRQLLNVSTLPGLQGYALALADVHPGYGAPIGSVGAFDMNEGVINFGLIGFDINCLPGDSKVLHEHGYSKSIKDFDGKWLDEKIKCLNPTTKLKNTKIKAFMKRFSEKALEAETESGKKIISTKEHPFFTKD